MLTFKIINLCIFVSLLAVLAGANPVPDEESGQAADILNIFSDPRDISPEIKPILWGLDYARKLPEMARNLKEKLMGKKKPEDVTEPQTQSPNRSGKKHVFTKNHKHEVPEHHPHFPKRYGKKHVFTKNHTNDVAEHQPQLPKSSDKKDDFTKNNTMHHEMH